MFTRENVSKIIKDLESNKLSTVDGFYYLKDLACDDDNIMDPKLDDLANDIINANVVDLKWYYNYHHLNLYKLSADYNGKLDKTNLDNYLINLNLLGSGEAIQDKSDLIQSIQDYYSDIETTPNIFED